MLQIFLSSTQTEVFCSSSVSKASLFQRHTGGAGAKHSGESWVQSPCDSYWLVRAPAWRLSGICLLHPSRRRWQVTMRRRPPPVSEVARTVLRGNCSFQNFAGKGEEIKKNAYLKCVRGVVCVSAGNGTTGLWEEEEW